MTTTIKVFSLLVSFLVTLLLSLPFTSHAGITGAYDNDGAGASDYDGSVGGGSGTNSTGGSGSGQNTDTPGTPGTAENNTSGGGKGPYDGSGGFGDNGGTGPSGSGPSGGSGFGDSDDDPGNDSGPSYQGGPNAGGNAGPAQTGGGSDNGGSGGGKGAYNGDGTFEPPPTPQEQQATGITKSVTSWVNEKIGSAIEGYQKFQNMATEIKSGILGKGAYNGDGTFEPSPVVDFNKFADTTVPRPNNVDPTADREAAEAAGRGNTGSVNKQQSVEKEDGAAFLQWDPTGEKQAAKSTGDESAGDYLQRRYEEGAYASDGSGVDVAASGRRAFEVTNAGAGTNDGVVRTGADSGDEPYDFDDLNSYIPPTDGDPGDPYKRDADGNLIDPLASDNSGAAIDTGLTSEDITDDREAAEQAGRGVTSPEITSDREAAERAGRDVTSPEITSDDIMGDREAAERASVAIAGASNAEKEAQAAEAAAQAAIDKANEPWYKNPFSSQNKRDADAFDAMAKAAEARAKANVLAQEADEARKAMAGNNNTDTDTSPSSEDILNDRETAERAAREWTSADTAVKEAREEAARAQANLDAARRNLNSTSRIASALEASTEAQKEAARARQLEEDLALAGIGSHAHDVAKAAAEEAERKAAAASAGAKSLMDETPEQDREAAEQFSQAYIQNENAQAILDEAEQRKTTAADSLGAGDSTPIVNPTAGREAAERFGKAFAGLEWANDRVAKAQAALEKAILGGEGLEGLNDARRDMNKDPDVRLRETEAFSAYETALDAAVEASKALQDARENGDQAAIDDALAKKKAADEAKAAAKQAYEEAKWSLPEQDREAAERFSRAATHVENMQSDLDEAIKVREEAIAELAEARAKAGVDPATLDDCNGPNCNFDEASPDAPKTDPDAPKTDPDAPKTDPDAPKTDPDAPKTSPSSAPAGCSGLGCIGQAIGNAISCIFGGNCQSSGDRRPSGGGGRAGGGGTRSAGFAYPTATTTEETDGWLSGIKDLKDSIFGTSTDKDTLEYDEKDMNDSSIFGIQERR